MHLGLEFNWNTKAGLPNEADFSLSFEGSNSFKLFRGREKRKEKHDSK